jgi:hypothetical protein
MEHTQKKSCREPGCGFDMPLGEQHCPHWGRPRLFPNVDMASTEDEQKGLDRRYQKSLRAAKKNKAEDTCKAFEAFAAETAIPVVARPMLEVSRVAKMDSELVATFAGRGEVSLTAGTHVIRGPKWSTIRVPAESALYGEQNRRELHFAALSPNDEGLSNYGDCSITLREELISHRTTVFNENMLEFFGRHGNKYFKTGRFPPGNLTVWDDRGKLAVAKHAGELKEKSDESDFPSVLLTSGSDTTDDRFIELHILGGMTVRTFEKVVLTSRPNGTAPAIVKGLRLGLKKHGVEWADRSTTR